MNRVIKFRYWDKEEKKWIPSITFGMASNGVLTHGEQARITVMQFTGLNDKNGNEIFEGDILSDEQYESWEWRGVVKFSYGIFGAEWLTNIKKKDLLGMWGQLHNLRRLDDGILHRKIVIGNIYDNPELLDNPCTP